MSMTIYVALPLLGSLIVLICGIFILIYGKSAVIHKLVSLICFSAFVWLFGYSLMYASTDAFKAMQWARFGYNGVLFIPALFYHFTCEFLNLSEKKYSLYLTYAVSAVFLISNRTSLFLSGIYKDYYWGFYPSAGILYGFFILFFFSIFIWCLFSLYVAFRSKADVSAVTRQRIRYIFAAFSTAAFFGVFDYIPNYGVEIYPAGYIGAVLWVFIVTYAILRFRVMDIRFAFKKTMIYSLSAGLLTGFFIILVLLLSKFLSGLAGIDELRISIISALIIAVLFAPLKNRIQKLIDKAFYKTTYNYYAVIQNVSRELSSKLYLKDIQKFITDLVFDTLKLKEAHFLLAGKKFCVTVYYRKANAEDATQRQRMDADSDLVSFLINKKDIIIREELPGIIEQDKADRIAEDMFPFKGDAAVPVIIDGELRAVMILGGKQSGDIFNDEDISLLRTVSNETALSMKGASLYAEKLRSEKLATLGLTASTLAHEIKNPLSSIKTFSQLLPEKYADSDFRETFASIVPSEIQRIDNLVTELLTFAKQAPAASPMERFEISALIDDSLKLLSKQFQKNGIKVIRNYGERIFIRGERDRIKQALINIISNGCQAMEGGGSLKITAGLNDKVTIIIEDTGPGIAEKDMEKIFEPFFTTKETGNGLGLTISKKIVDDHGGTISVASRRDEGTVFTLTFEPAGSLKEELEGGGQQLLWNY